MGNADFFSGFVTSGSIFSKGFTLPNVEVLDCFEGENIRGIDPMHVLASGNLLGNRIFISSKRKCVHPIRVLFHDGATNNTIVIGDGAEIYGSFNIHGSGCFVVFGESIPQWSMVNARLWSNNQSLFWGKGSTSNGVDIVMQGYGGVVAVGDDCMFANNIYIRNSDMHPVVDLSAKKWINPPEDVVINRHVWVGQEALVMKGVHVGVGAIIGAKSLVNKEVPAFSMVGGGPAKVIKNNVSWDRPEKPRAEIIAGLASEAGFF